MKYLTIAQICKMTGKAKATIHHHRRRGAFPGAFAVTSGDYVTTWLIPKEDVEGWLPNKPGRPNKKRQT